MTDTITFDQALFRELLDAALASDQPRCRQLGIEISAQVEAGGDKALGKALRQQIRKKGAVLQASRQAPPRLPVDNNTRKALVEQIPAPDTPVFLNDDASSVINGFVEDAENADLLKAQGLAPRLFLMLHGAPGTGKSLLAGHVASMIGRPLIVARLDSLISSKLGETAKNIREIFDYAAGQGSALFLDEMDAVAKLRDDRQELGELKRVVNTVLQGLDALPEDAVVISATNHPQLLDTAVWRRFSYSIEIALPELDTRRMMWQYFLLEDEEPDTPVTLDVLARLSEGLSGSDIEALAHASRRHSILDKKPVDLAALAQAIDQSKHGKPNLPARSPLGTEQKSALAKRLVHDMGVSKVNAATLLDVSRQMIYRYLN